MIPAEVNFKEMAGLIADKRKVEQLMKISGMQCADRNCDRILRVKMLEINISDVVEF